MNYKKIIPLFFNRTGAPVGQYTLLSDSFTSAGIYRKSDSAPKTLLRTLWAQERQTAGTHTLYWDGLDDLGNDIIATNDYEAQILSHDIQDDWGTVGNTATLNHGPTTIHGYSRQAHACPIGDYIYVGESWNEGGNKVAFKIAKADMGQWIKILPGSAGGNNTNISTEYSCTDGVNIYWAGEDPGNGNNRIFATKISDDTEVVWASGSAYSAAGGRNYASVLGTGTDKITGLATDGTYLWVAYESLDEIHVYNVSTGAATAASPISFTAPRSLAYQAANGGRVYFIYNTGAVIKGEVGANGNLTSGTLTISDFPSDKITMAVDNLTDELAIVVGGTTQQVWFWDITAANPSGTNSGKLGQVGGYTTSATDVLVADDKFNFEDGTTGLAKGLNKPYVAYDPATSYLYVGDVGCNRMQIYNDARVFVDTFMFLPAVYRASLDMHLPLNAYAANGQHYQLALDGTWTLYRNFGAQIDADHYSQDYGNFPYIHTFPLGTFATLDNNTTFPPNTSTEIVELLDTGIRYTGVFVNETGQYFGNYLDHEFNIWNIYSASYAVGQTPIIRTKTLTSFDGSNNPVYSGWTTVCTLQPITADDCLIDSGNTSFHGITDDGIIILKNKELTTTALWHLQGYDLNTGNLVWSIYRPTLRAGDVTDHIGYNGVFPNPSFFERGNGVNTNTFAEVQVLNNSIVLMYNGENWRAVQTNYINWYHTNGLVVGQYGTDRWRSEAIEEAGERSTGNGFNFKIAAYDADTYLLAGSDEGYHSAMHLWRFTNVSSIAVQTIDVAPPVFETLEGMSLMDDVTFGSVLTTTGNITVSNANASGWTVQSGVAHYDSYAPDIYLALNGTTYPSTTRSLSLDLPAYNPALKSHKIFGDISFINSNNLDSVDAPNSILEVLDDGGLVIGYIGMRYLTDKVLEGNSTTILDISTTNLDINVAQQWQNFSIKTNSLGCEFRYGSYPAAYGEFADPSANWEKPTSVRFVVKDLGLGDYVKAIAGKRLRYVDYTASDPAPIITNLTTISSTEVQMTFDRIVSATTAGFSMKLNSGAHTINSISGSLNVWILNVDPMATGDTLELSYDSTTGNTLNGDGVELVTFTDAPITNVINPASYTVLTYVQDSDTGFNGTFDAPAFNCQAGKIIEVAVWNYGYLTCTGVTDTAGNTYTEIVANTINGFSTWYAINTSANATNVVTATFSGFTACVIHVLQSDGIATVSPIAVTAKGDSTGVDVCTSDSFTTLQPDQAVTCFSCINTAGATWTVPAGYTDAGTDALGRINTSWRWYTSIQTSITIDSTTTGFTDDKYQSIICKKLA